MNRASRRVASSIEELLVAMAEGVRDAQATLDEASDEDALGQPRARYHLPYLDFDIKLTAETQAPQGSENGDGPRPPGITRFAASLGRRSPLLRLSLPDAGGQADGSVMSSLSGRFVSIPPDEGLPRPRLALREVREGGRRRRLRASLVDDAGRPLEGVVVEFNIDMAASQALSGADGIDFASRKPATGLEAGVVSSSAAGEADVLLTLSPAEPAGASLVVVATAGRRSRSLVIRV